MEQSQIAELHESERRQMDYSPDQSPLRSLNVLIRQRRIILWTTAAVLALAVLIALARPVAYTASASFMSSAPPRNASSVSTLAAQFGVDIGTTEGPNSPLLYPDVILSSQFLSSLLEQHYASPGHGIS